jgi:hypothetical protein
MQANYTLSRNPLSLDRIRSILNRLEDTIIFSLIERAQFAHNPKIYERGVFNELKALQFNGSWLEWFLKETEAFHAKARRYTRLVPSSRGSFPRLMYDETARMSIHLPLGFQIPSFPHPTTPLFSTQTK